MFVPPTDLDLVSRRLQEAASRLRRLDQEYSSLLNDSPWMSPEEAAPLLRLSSGRALRNRIKAGRLPPGTYRELRSPTGKRVSYLVNVRLLLKRLG